MGNNGDNNINKFSTAEGEIEIEREFEKSTNKERMRRQKKNKNIEKENYKSDGQIEISPSDISSSILA